MFTFKFEGLTAQDDLTGYTYGSLPAKPELGHIIVMEESETRYTVIRIDGEGLEGEGSNEQKELAWAEIASGKKVPTLWLQKLSLKEQQTQPSAGVLVARTRSFDAPEVKEWSQTNRRMRLSGEGNVARNETPSCPEHEQPMRYPTSLRLASGNTIENLHFCPVEGCAWRYHETDRYKKATDF